MPLFWCQGCEATSLAQLHEATGLSSASRYGAYGSKGNCSGAPWSITSPDRAASPTSSRTKH
ncbi:hypothetical protein NP777_39910 [Streptomyces sp. RCU064]|uniref:Uncharacterized protein n=1 Tax=Streptomyces rugosispiralis TaxID=2967341 RepID=A0ABT1VA72_9ACTN|nr:hypothetical protein [Streptomyces rugosispiralis]